MDFINSDVAQILYHLWNSSTQTCTLRRPLLRRKTRNRFGSTHTHKLPDKVRKKVDPEAKKRFRIEPGGVIWKREIAPDGHTHELPEKVWKKGDPEAKNRFRVEPGGVIRGREISPERHTHT
jgi:hypothetical protein